MRERARVRAGVRERQRETEREMQQKHKTMWILHNVNTEKGTDQLLVGISHTQQITNALVLQNFPLFPAALPPQDDPILPQAKLSEKEQRGLEGSASVILPHVRQRVFQITSC